MLYRAKIILPEVDRILLSFIDIIENCKNSSDSKKKQLNIALSTVLLNISVLNIQHDFSMETKASVLDISRSLLANSSDQESQFRILVALGTMLQEGRMKLVARQKIWKIADKHLYTLLLRKVN